MRPKVLSVRPRVRDAQGTQETQRLSSEASTPTQLPKHTGVCPFITHTQACYNHRQHGGEIGQHELTLESMLVEVVS